MAIDTAAKRNSALLDFGNMPWPPDGTIAVGDRLVMLEFYSGVAATVVSYDSLCICDLSFTVNSLSVSFAPVNDLDIEFTPPCDC